MSPLQNCHNRCHHLNANNQRAWLQPWFKNTVDISKIFLWCFPLSLLKCFDCFHDVSQCFYNVTMVSECFYNVPICFHLTLHVSFVFNCLDLASKCFDLPKTFSFVFLLCFYLTCLQAGVAVSMFLLCFYCDSMMARFSTWCFDCFYSSLNCF
jgi:hypothetical protein